MTASKWRAPLSDGPKALHKVVRMLECLASVRKVYAVVHRTPARCLALELVPSRWDDREIARKVMLNQLDRVFSGHDWVFTVDLLEEPHRPAVIPPRTRKTAPPEPVEALPEPFPPDEMLSLASEALDEQEEEIEHQLALDQAKGFLSDVDIEDTEDDNFSSGGELAGFADESEPGRRSVGGSSGWDF